MSDKPEMSAEDREMLEGFAQEVTQIRDRLKPIVAEIRQRYDIAANYEKFGQIIDGIYGTATTLGFKELGAYCFALKNVNYKCSQASNIYAMGQVKEIDLVAMQLLDKFIPIILNPAEVRKIQYTMQKECEKAEALNKKFFANITRKTTAA